MSNGHAPPSLADRRGSGRRGRRSVAGGGPPRGRRRLRRGHRPAAGTVAAACYDAWEVGEPGRAVRHGPPRADRGCASPRLGRRLVAGPLAALPPGSQAPREVRHQGTAALASRVGGGWPEGHAVPRLPGSTGHGGAALRRRGAPRANGDGGWRAAVPWPPQRSTGNGRWRAAAPWPPQRAARNGRWRAAAPSPPQRSTGNGRWRAAVPWPPQRSTGNGRWRAAAPSPHLRGADRPRARPGRAPAVAGARRLAPLARASAEA